VLLNTQDPTNLVEAKVEEEEKGDFLCALTGRMCPRKTRTQVRPVSAAAQAGSCVCTG
jgi:hypothetical protein